MLGILGFGKPLAGDLWPKFCQVIVNLNNIPLGMQTKIIPKTTPRITGEISAPVDHDMFRHVWVMPRDTSSFFSQRACIIERGEKNGNKKSQSQVPSHIPPEFWVVSRSFVIYVVFLFKGKIFQGTSHQKREKNPNRLYYSYSRILFEVWPHHLLQSPCGETSPLGVTRASFVISIPCTGSMGRLYLFLHEWWIFYG